MIIWYCLLHYINNPESKYSAFQLLTSDSSCLIPCHSRSQPRSSVLHRRSDLPRNRLWAPASRRFTNIIFNYNVQLITNFPKTQQSQLQGLEWRYAGLAHVQGTLDARRRRRTMSLVHRLRLIPQMAKASADSSWRVIPLS